MPVVCVTTPQSKEVLHMRKRMVAGWFVVFFLLILPMAGMAADADSSLTVTRDDKGVWFISGDDDVPLYDVFKAMGHAVATDRLWQMELYRRTATGRMAEVFGDMNDGGFIETDMFMRTLGYSEEELTQAFAALPQETQDVIQGYADGINQRIAEIQASAVPLDDGSVFMPLLPFEFAAVGLLPEEWTVEQILAWTALMQRNFDPEALETGQLDNAELLTRLCGQFGTANGFAMFNDLRWTNDPAAPSVIDHASGGCGFFSGVTDPSLQVDPRAVADTMRKRHDRMLASLEKVNARVKMGSYAWVVSGSKTWSGRPIIYSGPQMGFSVPSIVLEGSIRAGGLDISGMSVPGLPGIVIGRTPHHAWSMQVGHAHTTDYYFEDPRFVTKHRTETILIRDSNQESGFRTMDLPVYRSPHGPIVNPLPYNPNAGLIVSWKYSHWNYEFDSISGFLKLARATSMDQFQAGIRELGVSQHFCYADRDGNIAYWMSGRDPVRPAGEWRLPQGALAGVYQEWDSTVVQPLSTDRNTPRGWYGGWNNKSNDEYPSGFNGVYTTYGPFHRAHVIYDYLDRKLKMPWQRLSFRQVRDLALYIATTDSFYGGGNPWEYVQQDFRRAVWKAGLTRARFKALRQLQRWDGHFVEGGPSQWVSGPDRAEAWVLMDQWIDEVLRLTFFDELAVPDGDGGMVLKESSRVLFNVLLHGLNYPNSLTNNYNWFQNLSDPDAPQDADSIIVAALDNVLAGWSALPSETFERGFITYDHDLIGEVWKTPQASRSTYAHCVMYGHNGPVRIESMFPLGESGQLWIDPANPTVPILDDNFRSMTPEFDGFAPREFPLF